MNIKKIQKLYLSQIIYAIIILLAIMLPTIFFYNDSSLAQKIIVGILFVYFIFIWFSSEFLNIITSKKYFKKKGFFRLSKKIEIEDWNQIDQNGQNFLEKYKKIIFGMNLFFQLTISVILALIISSALDGNKSLWMTLGSVILIETPIIINILIVIPQKKVIIK
ncbi:MAG: hypothetical protein HRT99_04220 [Mycoplasmatales bacterium]|nr:hypothetical protein [Mycoplasmatales bacterium]